MTKFEHDLATHCQYIEIATQIAAFVPAELLEEATLGNHGEVYINTPYDLDAIKRIKVQLGAAGFQLTEELQPTFQPVFWVNFAHPDYKFAKWQECHVQIAFRADYSNATCKVNVLQERQEPVYEIVCQEA